MSQNDHHFAAILFIRSHLLSQWFLLYDSDTAPPFTEILQLLSFKSSIMTSKSYRYFTITPKKKLTLHFLGAIIFPSN